MVFEIGGVVALVAIGFWLWALIECIVTPGSRCRTLPKLVWVLVILLLQLLRRHRVVRVRSTAPRGGHDRTTAGSRAQRRPTPVQDTRPPVDAGAMSDRRSAELDRQLDAWEAEQAREGSEPEEH